MKSTFNFLTAFCFWLSLLCKYIWVILIAVCPISSATVSISTLFLIDEATKRTEQYNFLAYYERYWYSDEEYNQIIISSIDRANSNEFTFDWCFYKGNYGGIIYNLKATMINDNTAIFNTDDNDSDKEMWAGADGIIKFENNSITLNITNSQCYYIGDGLSFIYTNHDNYNKEYFEHLDTKGAYLEYYKKKYVE